MPEKRVSIEKATKMLNFLRAMEGVGEAQRQQKEAERKAAFEQMKFAAEQRRKERQFIINKRIDYMKTLEPGSASRDLARARNKDWFETLSASDREAFAPYMEQLFSPNEEKMLEFIQIHGKRPPVDRDPTNDPLGYGTQVLGGKRYDWQVSKFMGKDPGPYPDYAPVTAETYLLHKQGDRPRLISTIDETLNALGKTLPGTPTVEALVAAGGRWRTKEPSFIDAGPDRYMVTPMKDHFSARGETWTETQKIFNDPTKEIQSMPKLAIEFGALLDVDTDDLDLKSPAAGYMLSFKKVVDAGGDPDEALSDTIGRATGWTYRFFPKKIVVDYGFDYEGGTIAGVPGVELYWPANKPNTVYTVYHDESTGWYYGSNMKAISRSMEEAMAWAATQDGVPVK